MSDQPPPPGSPGSVPPGQPSTWPPAAPYATPHPGAGGAAYGRPLSKPGTVPLRPLNLGDFFDGAFATVRRNPRATIGLAAVVLAVAMAIPIAFSAVVASLGGFTALMDPDVAASDLSGVDVGIFGASLTAGAFAAVADVIIAGLIVPVVTRATLGEYIAPAEAWRRARGRLLRLIGLSLLELVLAGLIFGVLVGGAVLLALAAHSLGLGIGLGVLGALVAAVLALAMHVRWFQLAAPALVSERLGVLAAMGRAQRLSRGQFWRILGLFLLLLLVTGVVQQIISVPFSVVGSVLLAAFPQHGGFLGLLVSSNLASVVSGAVVAPFTGAVAVLQYLDQRFRKEGFDLELITYVQNRR